MVCQLYFDRVFGFFLGAVRDIHIAFRAAIAASLLIIHDAAAQRYIRRVLVGLGDGGEDVEATRVGVFLELLVHQLARHFSDEFGVDAKLAGAALDVQGFVLGLLVLR